MQVEDIYKQIVRFHTQPPQDKVVYAKWIRYLLLLVAITPFVGLLLYASPTPPKGSHASFMLGQLIFWPFGVFFLIFFVTGLYYKVMPDRAFTPSYPISQKFSFLVRALFYLVVSLALLWFSLHSFLARYSS